MKNVLAPAICGVVLTVSGCSSSTSDSPSGSDPGTGSPPPSYTVLITGPLKGDEPASKATHDGVVGGTRDQASKLGDVAHGAFLTADSRKEFLAIDRWTSHDGITSFFGNADVQKAFGNLLAAPPETSIWQPQSDTDWTQWGDPALLKGGSTKYIFTFRGQVKGSATESSAAHNKVVAQGRDIANQLGDVAHFVYLGDSDKTQILAIDVWTSLEGAQKFFSDPGFPQGALTIYQTLPVVKTWGTTDWAQW